MRKIVVFASFVLLAVTAAALAAIAAAPPNLSKALEAQRALAADRPGDPQVLNDLGNLLVLSGRTGEAEDAYRRAVEIAPDMVSARYNLALLLAQAGQPKEALRELEHVVELQPEHAWAVYQIGAIHDLLGAERKAVEFYARAFRLDPQLAFSSVNPHVIDNEHVTKAMLKAYRDMPLAGQAPKSYEQPARIVSLMVPAPGQPSEAAPAVPAAPGVPAEGVRPGAVFDPQDGTAAPPEADPRREGGRTLREEDLERGENLNQVVAPGAVYRPPPQGGRRFPVQPQPQGAQPGRAGQDGRGSDVQGRQPENRQRFVPGIPSTGRLEIELVPGSGADELAPAG